jgi:hypothetical protein
VQSDPDPSIGGYGFAHGEPGAKKALAGVAAGTGIAVLAVKPRTRFSEWLHANHPQSVAQLSHRLRGGWKG